MLFLHSQHLGVGVVSHNDSPLPSLSRTALRVEGVLDGVAHHDERKHGDGQCGGRVEQHHRIGLQVGLCAGDIATPAHRGGRQTDAKEA